GHREPLPRLPPFRPLPPVRPPRVPSARSAPQVAASETSTELRSGALVGDHYVVERVVGRMGGCVLVKVRHARREQRFELKYLLEESSAELLPVEQFLHRARKAMLLQSEFTARMVDVGQLPSGAPYVVSELFPGSALREVLRVRGVLAPSDAVDIVLQAAEAVAEAHRHGLIHGSLSPSTLWMTNRADGTALIKVSEFGSSETLRANPFSIQLRDWNCGTAAFSETRRLWDTLAYSAPEQLRGSGEVTPLSDVWALGAILYEALAGSAPFQGSSVPALLAAICADAPPSMRRRGVPRALERVVSRCLAKRPTERFPSVAELAVALQPFALPEARLRVDRIVRMQRVESAASQSSNARHDPSSVARVAARWPRVPVKPRVRALRPIGMALLAALAGAGGIAAGTSLARTLASEVEIPSLRNSESTNLPKLAPERRSH
ncbi:MAG TPA: serine/threonine-protein kinase, partial [Polyangiaceae bacterium]